MKRFSFVIENLIRTFRSNIFSGLCDVCFKIWHFYNPFSGSTSLRFLRNSQYFFPVFDILFPGRFARRGRSISTVVLPVWWTNGCLPVLNAFNENLYLHSLHCNLCTILPLFRSRNPFRIMFFPPHCGHFNGSFLCIFITSLLCHLR